MLSLPKLFDYSEPHPVIPQDTINYNSSVVPLNGSSFQPSSQIILDLPRMDAHLIPDSLYIKFTCAIVSATLAQNILGTPVYTPFQRVEVQSNGTFLESQNGFNFVQNMVCTLTLNYAQKIGAQSSYGYSGSDNNQGDMDGRTLSSTTGETFSVSAPLSCILSNCQKAVPLSGPQFRLIFTLDTLQNMFGFVGTSTLSSLTISNFELFYNIVQFPQEVRTSLLNIPRLSIKSLTFIHSTQPLPVGVSGAQFLTFNVRAMSIKALFLTFTPSALATAPTGVGSWVNNGYDCFDCTNGNSAGSQGGDYSVIINGQQYPNKVLSVLTGRSGLIMELKKAASSLGVEYDKIYDKNNDINITNAEWNYPATTSPQTTKAIPSKFIIGISTERFHNNKVMFSGVNSQSSSITVRVNIPSATTLAFNANLTCVCDALLNIDQENGITSVVV
jgi:hypothetical protein